MTLPSAIAIPANELPLYPEFEALFIEYLNPTFVEPLQELGFTLTHYSQMAMDDLGTHTLIFSSDEKSIAHAPNFWNELEQIATQDDDSQPHATYRYYYGTLFLYIPFFA